MKKLCKVLLAVILILSMCILPADAESPQKVYDQAQLFTPEKVADLEAQLAVFRDTYSCDLVITTTADTGGIDSYAYAESFYIQNGMGIGDDMSGGMLLIDMANREIVFYTAGVLYDRVSDYSAQSITDSLVSYLGDQAYDAAADQFIALVNNKFAEPVPEGIPQDGSVTADPGTSAPAEPEVPDPYPDNSQKIHDYSGLVPASAITNGEKSLKAFNDKYDLDIGIVILNEYGSPRTLSELEKYYNEKGFGAGSNRDGGLLLINLKSGSEYFYISEKVNTYFSTYVAEDIADEIAELMADGSYNDALTQFPQMLETRIIHATTVQPYEVIVILLICIAFFIAGTLFIRYRYKKYKGNVNTEIKPTGKLHLNSTQDLLINTTRTRRHKPPKQSNNNHHSSGSRPSSGRSIKTPTRSGGGRSKF